MEGSQSHSRNARPAVESINGAELGKITLPLRGEFARPATSRLGLGSTPTSSAARQHEEAQELAKTYWEGVHPYNLGGGYVNFMSDDEGEARVRASYGANYDRLVSVMQKYDPNNLFHLNPNITPRAARAA